MGQIKLVSNAAAVVYERNKGLPPATFGFLLGRALDLATGPDMVLIRHDPEATERAFELIFRLLLRRRDGGIESWMIFRREREWQYPADDVDQGCILWYSTWEHTLDRANVEQTFSPCPTVRITVHYVSERESRALGSHIQTVDGILGSGVSIGEVARPHPPVWRELSLWRSLDWGKIDITWNASRGCVEVERALAGLSSQISEILRGKQPARNEIAAIKLLFGHSAYLPGESDWSGCLSS